MLSFLLSYLHSSYLLPFIPLSFIAASYLAAWCRLRHFPGPLLASFSYFWMLRICRSGVQAASYEHLHDTYGSHVVRIGPNDLITDDPSLIRRMSAARSTYRRSSWYTSLRMNPYDEGLFSLTDTAAHDRLKAKLAFGYGGRENQGLERDVDGMIEKLVGLIRGRYLSDERGTRGFDLATAAQYFTMDVITKVAYGKEFGYLERDEDVFHAIQGAEEGIPFLVVLAELPFLGWLFTRPWVLKLVGPKKTDEKGLGRMLGIAEKVVTKRFGPDAKDQQDMLGAFVRHGVTQRQCEIEVPFQLVAGSDTTATAIRGTMLHLTGTMHAYIKLQKEIDAAIAEGRISKPITAEEGKGLQYLQAVIYEGLRMQIPFSGLLMKQVPPEGDTIDGRIVPGGTRVGHNTKALMRRKDIFGDDADIFRPERWLGISPEQKQLMVQTTELVFGYGRWGCSGKSVAFLELNKIYVELLRRFDFEIMYPKGPWREFNTNMFFHSDLWMRVTERGE
ncbi:cytochrome P450 [Parathielavia appendiculata]|uniref:Cytochrome P450 monooxygenase ABA1 n=1 Tax=Parathielavia appendiculata TaxID=2587402 RepID=A0AAN6YY65_9PEZI|nr:cytochrome P450 [Parathielavia appendiculata]